MRKSHLKIGVFWGLLSLSPGLALGTSTATIQVGGTTLTFMPCSWTGTLASRDYEVRLRYAICYSTGTYDGPKAVYRNFEEHHYKEGLFMSGNFLQTFRVVIPQAAAIHSISANARVIVNQAYGIHGVWSIYNDATASSSGHIVTMRTARTGQETTQPGATALFGLLPNWEDSPVEGDVPEPPVECDGITPVPTPTPAPQLTATPRPPVNPPDCSELDRTAAHQAVIAAFFASVDSWLAKNAPIFYVNSIYATSVRDENPGACVVATRPNAKFDCADGDQVTVCHSSIGLCPGVVACTDPSDGSRIDVHWNPDTHACYVEFWGSHAGPAYPECGLFDRSCWVREPSACEKGPPLFPPPLPTPEPTNTIDPSETPNLSKG